MQAQPTRTRGNEINKWTGAAVGVTVFAILALGAFSGSDTSSFREAAGQARVATALETLQDHSSHRHAGLQPMIAASIVQPATRPENELVLAGHRYMFYLNEGMVTSRKAAAPAAARPAHRYDLLEQQR